MAYVPHGSISQILDSVSVTGAGTTPVVSSESDLQPAGTGAVGLVQQVLTKVETSAAGDSGLDFWVLAKYRDGTWCAYRVALSASRASNQPTETAYNHRDFILTNCRAPVTSGKVVVCVNMTNSGNMSVWQTPG
jgi:hypothetical protein